MYDIEFKRHDEEQVLEMVVTGKIDLDGAMEISAVSREKAYKLDYQLLKDMGAVELDAGIIDVMDFFDKTINKKLEPEHKQVIAALYVDGKKLDYWKFWETVSSNNGLISKIFVNKDEAFKWLQNKAEEKQN